MQNQGVKFPASDPISSHRSLAASSKPDTNSASRAPASALRAATQNSPASALNRKSAGGKARPSAERPEGASPADTPGDDTKKRVRLKPETREQLLERLRNPPLSLHETSILLRVSRATVRRYADAGRLPCLRTPGGQRRFALRDIETFYRQLKTKR